MAVSDIDLSCGSVGRGSGILCFEFFASGPAASFGGRLSGKIISRLGQLNQINSEKIIQGNEVYLRQQSTLSRC